MAEHKPFRPTTLRLQRARENGDIPMLGSLPAIATLIAISTLSVVCMVGIALQVIMWLRACLNFQSSHDHGGIVLSPVSFPWFVCILLSVPLVHTAVHGLLGGCSWRPLRINWGRCLPAHWWSSTFGREAREQHGRSALLVTMGTVISTYAVVMLQGNLLACGVDIGRCIVQWWHVLTTLCAVLLIMLAAFAIYERWSRHRAWIDRHRMSFVDVQREVRESFGDPHQRSERKRRARRLRSLPRDQALRQATVVVTNPTHLAIALRYAPPEDPVPRVLIRSADHTAIDVRECARRYGVPIIADRGVARILFARVEEGQYIPVDLYDVVAPLIAMALIERS